jgi:hypothetical protein
MTAAALDPGVLFNASGIGMLLHLACSAMLRSQIAPEDPLSGELFGSPVLGDFIARRWLLQGKYFLPWVGPPTTLKSRSSLPQFLFWGARLGAFVLTVAFPTFLLLTFWQVAYA